MRRTAPLALAGLALAGTLAGCSGADEQTLAPPSSGTRSEPSSTTPSSSSPSSSPTPSGSPAPSGETSARAVYYLMDTGRTGPRLYREFATRPAADDPLRDALEAMFDQAPDDPDYTSLWPAGSAVLDVTRDGDLATVDLSAEAKQGQAGSLYEAVSVQQLIYTATAADPDVQRVAVRIEGEMVDTLWGAVSLQEPLSRGPAVENLGPIWLLTPTEGGTLAQGAEFGGQASAFEATVNWEWVQGDTVVAEGFSSASEGAPGRGDWSGTVDVPPGDYVLRAFESSAEDGQPTFVDTKRVTVTG